MRRIQKSDSEYTSLVEIRNPSEYSILAKELHPGEEVVCPNDSDMLVKKNTDGTISIIKKCYNTKCFSKQP